MNKGSGAPTEEASAQEVVAFPDWRTIHREYVIESRPIDQYARYVPEWTPVYSVRAESNGSDIPTVYRSVCAKLMEFRQADRLEHSGQPTKVFRLNRRSIQTLVEE